MIDTIEDDARLAARQALVLHPDLVDESAFDDACAEVERLAETLNR